jgi:Kef-type K+ transport system membrane component KefB
MHSTGLLLTQLALLLAVARLAGAVARRAGLPSVVGEILGGVLLGPSVLGLLAPSLQASLFSADQLAGVQVVGMLGLITLMLVTGIETDLHLVLRRKREAIALAAGGFVGPMLIGLAIGWLLPAHLHGPRGGTGSFMAFVAVATSISAVPVIAKVLLELKLTRRDIGQLILSVAMLIDTVAWVVVSSAEGLSRDASGRGVALAVAAPVVVVGVAWLAGRPLVARLYEHVTDFAPTGTAQLTLTLVLGLGGAALAAATGLEPILGAFVAGLLVTAAPHFRREVAHQLEGFVGAVLAPVFFALSGMRLDLGRLADPTLLAIAGLILAGTLVGKFSGVWAAGALTRLSTGERTAVATALCAKGAMGLVVATIGHGTGAIGDDMYSVLVLVSLVTSIAAPMALRPLMRSVTPSPEEQARLDREERVEASFAHRISRVLIPTRGGPNVRVAARLMAMLSPGRAVQATALFAQAGVRGAQPRAASPPGSRALDDVQRSLQSTPAVTLSTRTATARSVAEAIVGEAARGYDLVVLGASEEPGSSALLNQLIADVVRAVPCATLVFRWHDAGVEAPDQWRPRRILVPTVGTEYSRSAVELAAALATSSGASLVVVTVVSIGATEQVLLGPGLRGGASELGREIVDAHADLARQLGASVETRVLVSERPEMAVLELASELGCDLVLMGSNLRPVSGRAYYGRFVDHVFNHGRCPVMVLNSR